MGNQIESSSYAAGITVQPSLQTKTAQSEKDKKKLNKFKEMLRSVLPQTQPENEADILEQLSKLPQEQSRYSKMRSDPPVIRCGLIKIPKRFYDISKRLKTLSVMSHAKHIRLRHGLIYDAIRPTTYGRALLPKLSLSMKNSISLPVSCSAIKKASFLFWSDLKKYTA